MTMEIYIYAFLACLVATGLTIVVAHIIANLPDQCDTDRWMPANPDDYDQRKGTSQLFSGSQDTGAESLSLAEQRMGELLKEWEAKRSKA